MMRSTLRLAVAFGLIVSTALADETIDFNRDVRPILSNHCWNCHGLDEHARQAGLRLDRRDDALAKLESGVVAVAPGDLSASELVKRIETTDVDVMMPPPSYKRPLSDKQRATLRKWIEQGAAYAGHWAFAPPVRHEPPQLKNSAWAKNEIDRFVLSRLESEGIAPSPEADRSTWLRRVTLDLTGLPPSLEELDAFLADGNDGAHERVVDRLLASPRHAERMAALWLDAARFADTNGYNNDETRTMWPWRDWVIRAFQQNMPYDQFVVEQLAGDLLPNATLSQRVATGFNRNHVLTTEGGIVEEEYHVEYVADRIHTTSTVFLAISMQCARCHDHKFDPVTQRDYYRFAAFLNNVPDRIVPYSSAANQDRMADPVLAAPSPEQADELSRLASRRDELAMALANREATCDDDLAKWEASLTPERIAELTASTAIARLAFDDGEAPTVDAIDNRRRGRVDGAVAFSEGKTGRAASFAGGHIDLGQLGDFEADQPFTLAAWVKRSAGGALGIVSKIDDTGSYRGYDLLLEDGKLACHVVDHWPDKGFKVVSKALIPQDQWSHVAAAYDGSRVASGLKLYVDGKLVEVDVTTNNKVEGSLRTDKPFHIGKRFSTTPFAGAIDDAQVFAMALSSEDVDRIARGESSSTLRSVLEAARVTRTAEQHAALKRWWIERIDDTSLAWRAEQAAIPGKIQAIDAAIPRTMVMAESEPKRQTFILKRGAYDQRGEEVAAGFPESLATASPELPNNRLGLARWLIDGKHPLTARVAVNRWWEMMFGLGIVETVEDFGAQGAYPTHPELLDWLATELVAQGWNQRAILRQIALSATYRQSSHARADLADRDPDNRLLARGPRYRVSAETLRDSALFVAGLLSDRVGGPSVKPYQPDGLWEEVSVSRRDKYEADAGEGIYRRGMYTFWKRTCPPPAMATFDAPDRETCVVRRARTNTPLQSLVLMNDPTYVEAARKLADRAMAAGADDATRSRTLFRIALSREPTADELSAIGKVKHAALARFEGDPTAADKLLHVGRAPRDERFPAAEAAAWSSVASVVLNLSEAVTKP